MDPLAFRCTSCGNCCRSLRVAITALDLSRLAAASDRPAEALVEWLRPEDVDMRGEPDSFVELREGRRLMVLAHRAGACMMLGPDQLCRTYAARPRDCRAFPFDFEPAADGRRRLTLLPLRDCDHAEDGQSDAPTLLHEDTERWRELRDYQRWVASWNRRAWHRRRLHKTLGNSAEFLELSLAQVSETAPTRSR